MVGAPGDLDVAAIRRIAGGEPVRLDDRLLKVVAAQREAVLGALTGQPVYGVNTGMGRLAGTPLTAEQQAGHQARLLIGRAVGGPPWLPASDVRALFAVRLRDLLTPESGASADAARFLADRLNDGFVPAVPATGSGSAGEIIPLSHAFQTFLGLGSMLDGASAADALARRAAEPYRPGPKEGTTFIQGAPIATAHAILRAATAAELAELQTLATALTIDAIGAPRGVYRPELAGPDPVLAGVLRRIQALTGGGTARPVVQAPVSVRVGPPALAYTRRAVAELEDATERALAAPTDSPSFVEGEFVSTAGFHAAELGLRMDAVAAALVHVGEISVQRTHRLLDERFSGLPAQLTPEPGPQAGLSPLHKRAAGELHALRRSVTAASLGSLDTSSGQEDVQVFALDSGERLRAALDHLLVITACELITAHQAHVLRGEPGAPALREAYRRIGELVPPVVEDRSLGPEVTAFVAALRSPRSIPSAPPAG
ncbi:aromatic amino acid lyase [Amycolatopsis alkalitolerans]|uniref:Histidine ammonia-lyase n=1 Tax=Amycolatopsis alkalitolerans TaxID=2547244 RepID=A0A5C4M686_9PSEU|nr:aromatic amino acid lyase [Amycolatopsis alkalitolerans]TNC28784.1 histidine ammonia-lyase [Amycolatopsis alkalitolerans]